MTTDIWLTVGERDFGGWVRLRAERSVDSACSQFGLVATRNWPGGNQPWTIAPGDAVELRIDEALVATGWIDNLSPGYDAGYHTIEISGRGKVCDLVDCSYVGPPNQWKQADPKQLITQIAAQHQIKVNFDTDLGEPLDFNLQPGEACWEAIERITRLRQVLVYDQPDGSLIVTRVSEEFCPTELVQGGNILTANATLDDKDRFSHYIVKGQQKAKKGDPKAVAQSVGEVRDPSITRYRPMVIVQSAETDNGHAMRRAEWEKQNRWGNGRTAEIKVQGLLQPNGEAWPVNRLVRLEDTWLGVDRELAITKVATELGSAGSTTTLTLQPPEALTPEPAELKAGTTNASKKKGGGAGGDNFWQQVAADREAGERRRASSKE